MSEKPVLVRKSYGSMGTGTEVRIYNPRSESSHMYRSNHDEEEGTYIPEDGSERDRKYEERQRKRDEEKQRKLKRKHIKIRPSDLPEDEEDEERDDSEKIDADRELHAQTGAAGNFGFLSSLANQARGPGASGGHAFAMSEPMKIGVRLLKTSPLSPEEPDIAVKPKRSGEERRAERRRTSEKRREWQPSTGGFDAPPGGTLGPDKATSRRAPARSRAIASGKREGLDQSKRAVDKDHRGRSVNQPKSKEPASYKEFLGRQDARRRTAGIRQPMSAQARFGQRTYFAGDTGGGRLQGIERKPKGQVRVKPKAAPRGQVAVGPRPRIKPHRIAPIVPPRMPKMPSLAAPQRSSSEKSMLMMSEKVAVGSPIQKRMFTRYDVIELRQLINQARRALKDKESKKKGMGEKDTSGAGSNLPKHPENGPKQTNKNEGGTRNTEIDPRTFGYTEGFAAGRGGHTP
tara:strand:- start:1707 stop:3083 length:1377 start_codon:yes stop_codon:yes gene_type:complete